MSNKVRVKFYAEHKDNDIASWRSPQPDFAIKFFQKELSKLGKIGDLDRFRIRWAGDKEEYLLEDFDVQTGWTWIENGIEKRVSIDDLNAKIPDGVIVAPFEENCKVFIPRFVIEEFRDGWYHKVWFVETVEIMGEENGRIDVLSRYREPSGIDLEMATRLRYLRDTLTDEEIESGVAAGKVLEANEKQRIKDAFIDECAEEFCKAITDGIPNAPQHDFSKGKGANYIKDYSKALIAEHNGAT